MKISKLIIVSIALISTLGLNSQNLNLEKSELEWTGSAAFNSYTLSGTLKLKNGSIEIKDNTITKLKIEVDMLSLKHENGSLEKHLRSKDFFEVKQYKTAVFEITAGSTIREGKATLVGNMTIKGTTKSETLEVSLNEDQKKITFEIFLDRTKYGIEYNSPSVFESLKENAIKDEFKLIGDLIFR